MMELRKLQNRVPFFDLMKKASQIASDIHLKVFHSAGGTVLQSDEFQLLNDFSDCIVTKSKITMHKVTRFKNLRCCFARVQQNAAEKQIEASAGSSDIPVSVSSSIRRLPT